MSKDPFTMTYEAIAEAIRISPALNALIPNLDKKVVDYSQLSSRKRPEKVSEAGLPELVLDPRGFTSNLVESSGTVAVERDYVVMLSSDSKPLIEEGLYAIEWALLSTLVTLNFDPDFNLMKWRDGKFIQNVILNSVDSGFSDPFANRGIQGYAAQWQIQVTMSFLRPKMVEYSKGN